MTKLEQLKAVHEAASPKATWVYEDALSAVVYVSGDRLKAAADLGKIDDSKPLGEFIALTHNSMSALLNIATLAEVALEVYLANGQSEEPSVMNSMLDIEAALLELNK